MTVSRVLVVVAALLLAACATVSGPDARSSGTRSAVPDATADTFDVVTLNLWHDKADWPTRQTAIVEALAALRPDVVVLQEVLQHETLPNQAASLAAALGYRFVFVSTDPPDAVRRYGNAILTRHAIEAEHEIALQPADDYRTAAHARLRIGARTLDVYATHLHHQTDGARIRAAQVADLLAFVQRTATADAIVLLGDFNTPAEAPELAALSQRFVEAYGRQHPDATREPRAHTTLNPAFHAPSRIDHVWIDAGTLQVIDARRMLDAPIAEDTWASDHFGVVARLAWINR